MDSNRHRRAVLAALLVAFLFSSSWVIIRWGLDDEALPPLTFAALRYAMAALVLLALVLGRGRTRAQIRRLERGEVGRLLVLGLLLYAVTQGGQFIALGEQPAATTSLVLSLTTLVVAVGGIVVLAETPTRQQVAGSLLVALGAWLYFSGDLGATETGMIAATVALGAGVVSSLLAREVNRSHRLPALVVTALSMAVGAAVLLVVGLGLEGLPDVSPRAWLLIAWLALVNTAFAFTLWNASLRHLSAVESSGITSTMLVQIAFLAWVFLGESPGAVGVVGVVLVSAGVFLTQVRQRPTAARVPTGRPGGKR